jgi:hypothetical protein
MLVKLIVLNVFKTFQYLMVSPVLCDLCVLLCVLLISCWTMFVFFSRTLSHVVTISSHRDNFSGSTLWNKSSNNIFPVMKPILVTIYITGIAVLTTRKHFTTLYFLHILLEGNKTAKAGNLRVNSCENVYTPVMATYTIYSCPLPQIQHITINSSMMDLHEHFIQCIIWVFFVCAF